LAKGASFADILAEYEGLTSEDLQACLLTEFGQHLQVYLEQVLAGQELLLNSTG
jgi:uncharacterized protein (DUF433 family)